MTEINEKIKSGILVGLLTFLGIWAFIITTVDVFFEEEFYSSVTMIFVAFLLSMLAGIAMSWIKRSYIVFLSFILIWGLIIWGMFDAVAGGCAYFVNLIIEKYGAYYGVQMLYIDFTKRMLREYDPELFCYLLIALMAFLNAFAINKRKLAFIPIVFVLAGLFLPVIVECFPSAFAMLLAGSYCIMMIVVMKAKLSKNQSNSIATMAAVIFGILVMLIGGFVSLIVPQDEYEQNEFFPAFRTEIRQFLTENIENIEFIDGNQTQPAVIGGGALGHIDELSFSNMEVLKVTLPAVRDIVYIKGFIGATYTSDYWEEPKEKEKDLFESLNEVNYSPEGMVACYLDALSKEGTLTGIKASMKIEKVASVVLYDFAPLYAEVTDDLEPSYDGLINPIPEGTAVTYYAVPDEVFKVSMDYIGNLMGSNKVNNNLRYADYVYDNYLDVNTPMADELMDQWGDYPIDTAAERYDVAYAIQDYLSDTCTYTTRPGKVPNDKDFVEYFLKETNEGYCTYFATAAVMMFRSAGIPARYVEGYCFDVSSGLDAVEYGSYYLYEGVESERFTKYCEKYVLDSDAHAWVEFYIDGIGWVDFEVTPGNSTIGSNQEQDEYNMNPENFKEEEPTTEEPTTENPTTEEVTSEEETTEKESKEEPTTEESTKKPTEEGTTTKTEETTANEGGAGMPSGGNFKKFDIRTLKIVFVILGCIALIVAVMLFIMVRHKKAMEKDRINREKDVYIEKSAIYEYMYYLKLMNYIKIHKPEYMTHKEFAEYVVNNTELVEENEASEFADMQEKAEYAKELLTTETIDKCRQYSALIRSRIYEQKNFVQKLIFKYIHNL